ncbi:MAG: maleylpyruvate isomerase N-terminal domain-containing protein, partial [Natronosporangium sp.]
MHGHSLIGQAAAPTVAIVRAIRADQLAAPTPCQEYDVRRLLNHLLYWG